MNITISGKYDEADVYVASVPRDIFDSLPFESETLEFSVTKKLMVGKVAIVFLRDKSWEEYAPATKKEDKI